MNTLTINGKEYTLTEEQAKSILNDYKLDKSKLADIEASKTCNIGDYEFIVLEHLEKGETVLILKDILKKSRFGYSNNYDGSDVDKVCNKFGEKIAEIIGDENLIEYTLDLTAGNGMKCYGEIKRKCSLINLDMLRKYGYILAEHNIDEWQWLATATGTEKWGTNYYSFCVSPSGIIGNNYCGGNRCGVRPFCIVKSNIFVSK